MLSANTQISVNSQIYKYLFSVSMVVGKWVYRNKTFVHHDFVTTPFINLRQDDIVAVNL